MRSLTVFGSIVFVVAFQTSFICKAETVRCTTKRPSFFSLTFSTAQPPTTPPSLEAKMKTGFFASTQEFGLKIASRDNNLNYSDYWTPKNFWISFGPYHGTGHYSNVVLNTSYDDQVDRFTLECDIQGPMQFKNYCQTTADNAPQANLYYAVQHADIDLLEATLACHVDVNEVGANGCSPLLTLSDMNCGTGQFDSIAGADINDMVSDLITAGARVDSRDPITGETALIKVARYQDLASAKLLLNAKANVNAQDKNGMTALMRAVEARYLKMVEFFAANGADLSLKNSSGMTALDIAKANGDTELYDALAGAPTVTIHGDKNGLCTPMNFNLALNKPNKIVVTTDNSMLMLTAKDLNINLMAMSGMSAEATITPTKAGQFMMNCGPQMSGNPMGMITVQ